MDEMAALEEQRMARMKQGGAFFARHRPNQLAAEDETAVLRAVNTRCQMSWPMSSPKK